MPVHGRIQGNEVIMDNMQNNKDTTILKNELKKHIYSIHSTNNVSLLQRKVSNALLFYAYRDLKEKRQFTIPIKDLKKLTGFDSNDIEKIKQAVLDLVDISVIWDVLDEDNSGEFRRKKTTILAGADVGPGYIIYEYSDFMKALLYHPEIYGKINMLTQAKFKSSYGLALYENCKRYFNVKKTPWLTLEKAGLLLGFDGIKGVYWRIKSKILSNAIKEVNKISEITINLEETKKGKRVEKIRFLIEHKSNIDDSTKDVLELNSDEDLEKIKLLRGYSVSNDIAVKIIKNSNNTLEFINQSINYVLNSSKFKAGEIEKVPGYIVAAINGRYCESKSNTHLINEKAREKALRSHNNNLNDNHSSINEKVYSLYLETALKRIIASFSQQDLGASLQSFNNYYKLKHKDNMVLLKFYTQAKFENDSFNHSVVNKSYYDFIFNNHLPKNIHILSKEQFYNDYVKKRLISSNDVSKAVDEVFK